MKNLNTIIKLTCFVLCCMLSTTAFSQANHDYIVVKKGENVVSNYDGSLQSIAYIINTNKQATVDKQITKLTTYLQEVTGNNVSTNDLDTMLDVTQNNLNTWVNAYDQLKVNHHDNDLYVIRSIIRNIKAKL